MVPDIKITLKWHKNIILVYMIPSALYTSHIKVPPAKAIPPTDIINNNATAICPNIIVKNG